MSIVEEHTTGFSGKRDIRLLLRVPRSSVVAAAEHAIRETRRMGYEISTAQVRRLLRVARTERDFLLGGWFYEGRCGCLVGNLLGRDICDDDGPALIWTGANFDTALTQRLTARQLEKYERDVHPAIVRVSG